MYYYFSQIFAAATALALIFSASKANKATLYKTCESRPFKNIIIRCSKMCLCLGPCKSATVRILLQPPSFSLEEGDNLERQPGETTEFLFLTKPSCFCRRKALGAFTMHRRNSRISLSTFGQKTTPTPAVLNRLNARVGS